MLPSLQYVEIFSVIVFQYDTIPLPFLSTHINNSTMLARRERYFFAALRLSQRLSGVSIRTKAKKAKKYLSLRMIRLHIADIYPNTIFRFFCAASTTFIACAMATVRGDLPNFLLSAMTISVAFTTFSSTILNIFSGL